MQRGNYVLKAKENGEDIFIVYDGGEGFTTTKSISHEREIVPFREAAERRKKMPQKCPAYYPDLRNVEISTIVVEKLEL